VLRADDPLSQGLALSLVLALGGLLAWRAIRKDRREYVRFRRYRATVKRQAMMRTWLLESTVLFGASAIVLLIMAHPFIEPLLQSTRHIGWVSWLVDAVRTPAGIAVLASLAAAAIAVTIVGVRSARREGGVVMVGNIAALLPRSRPELRWAGALSVNAGVSEELLFRWALPALLFVVTGEPLSAFALSLLLFASLHAYQGAPGIIGTALVGLVLTAAYVLSGSILVAIALHVSLDLRTLVFVPMAVYGVHRVPASVRFPKPLRAISLREVSEGQAEAGEGQAEAGEGSTS
jgi:uncharacterized protein